MKKKKPTHAPVKSNHWLEILVGVIVALLVANYFGVLPSFGDSDETPISVEESR